MMRCEHCGGHALAGLAHLHGNPCRPLCADCTAKVLEQRELQERQKLERELAQHMLRVHINRPLPKAA